MKTTPYRWGFSGFLWAFGLSFLLYVSALWWSPLNQDEGIYLYGARAVAEGRLPYIDFAFTQGPVLPQVYAIFHPLVHSFGVAGGRALTALWGLCSAVLAAALAAKVVEGNPLRRKTAAWIALALCGWNIYQVMFTTIVKTYALCSVFWTAGMLALVSVKRARSPRGVAALAGVLLALAAGTRISAGIAIPLAIIWLASSPHTKHTRAGWAFLLTAGLVSMGLWLPSLLTAPRSLCFSLVEYHMGRAAEGVFSGLALRAGFLSRVIRAGFPVILLTLLPFLPGLPRKNRSPLYGKDGGWLWAMIGLASGIHIAAPFPYDDYQVFLFPTLSALAAAGLVRWVDSLVSARAGPSLECYNGSTLRRVRIGIATLVLLHSFASPVLQQWALSGRDRIWWRFRTASDLSELRSTARRLQNTFPDTRRLLTQDLYLAIETGWPVPPGLELGPFSYFPGLPDDNATCFHVLNRKGLEQLLTESRAPVAAFSGYGLTIASPAVKELPDTEQARLHALLNQRYTLAFSVPGFGQAETVLNVYQLHAEKNTTSRPNPAP